jgi:hypothetical protein
LLSRFQNQSGRPRASEGTVGADAFEDSFSVGRVPLHRRHSHSRALGTRKGAKEDVEVTTDGQTDRQIDRQIDIKIDRQIDRQLGRQTNRQTN